MKILFLDIEITPNLAHVWGLWQQNVGLPQIITPSEMMCWVAKWKDDDELLFSSYHIHTKKGMVAKMWKLLNEADVVCHYNGRRFDVPHLNREFLEHGMLPPSPFKQIDLLETAKRQFKFPSNKLDYVSQRLGLGKKTSHEGHELWIKCMAQDPEAWGRMEEYNKQDVLLLEKLYYKLLPWIVRHPNVNLYEDLPDGVCIKCKSTEVVREGYAYTADSKFQQYRCKDCGSWFRGRKNLKDRTGVGKDIAG